MRVILVIVFAVVCLAGLGCVTHITPPETVAEPATVYLVDYGYHSSLILPGALSGPAAGAAAGGGERELLEFTFGQHDWYARNMDDWWRAPLVMLFPAQACLGRRELAGAVANASSGGAGPTARMLGAEEVHAITVESACAATLLHRLEMRWADGSAGALENPNVGMTFVTDPDDYWLFYNCNAAVAAWLRETGCRVGGLVVGSRWKVAR